MSEGAPSRQAGSSTAAHKKRKLASSGRKEKPKNRVGTDLKRSRCLKKDQSHKAEIMMANVWHVGLLSQSTIPSSSDQSMDLASTKEFFEVLDTFSESHGDDYCTG